VPLQSVRTGTTTPKTTSSTTSAVNPKPHFSSTSPPPYKSSSKLPAPGPRYLENVDKYTKQAHIGQGQYGIVWSGKNKETHEKVALKAVQIRNPNEGYPLTCLREINVLKKLQKNESEAHSRQGLVKLEDLVMKYEGMFLRSAQSILCLSYGRVFSPPRLAPLNTGSKSHDGVG